MVAPTFPAATRDEIYRTLQRASRERGGRDACSSRATSIRPRRRSPWATCARATGALCRRSARAVARDVRLAELSLRSSDHVIVVGAGLAGWRFAESLRREGYRGAITIVGDEHHAPYDRPPLSKQVLAGKWDAREGRRWRRRSEGPRARRRRLRLGTSGRQTRRRERRRSNLTTARSLEGTHVVIATGTSARPLSFPSSRRARDAAHRDDAERLDRELRSLPSESVVAVIGGGFVGAEVATSMKTRGLDADRARGGRATAHRA